jgi:hypothetical protein
VNRRDTIVEMLRRFHEAREAYAEGTGSGDDGHMPQMAKVWNTSFRELERCLKQLREERVSQYWHLCERYIKADRRQKELVYRAGEYLVRNGARYERLPAHCEVIVGFVTVGERGKHPKGTLGPGPCLVEFWQPKVRRQKVEHAVDRLVDTFRGTPYLPDEMFEAA